MKQPKNLRREVKDAMPVSFRSELFTTKELKKRG